MDGHEGKRRAWVGGLLLAMLLLAALLLANLDPHAPLAKNITEGLDVAGMPRPVPSPNKRPISHLTRLRRPASSTKPRILTHI